MIIVKYLLPKIPFLYPIIPQQAWIARASAISSPRSLLNRCFPAILFYSKDFVNFASLFLN